MGVGFLYRKGLPFANVANSGVAIAKVEIGRTIESISLKLGNNAGAFTKSMITLVRIKANGKVIFEGSAAQIDKLNAFRGYTLSATYLDINFEDLTGLTEGDRQVGSLDTSAGLVSLTIEATIAGATNPTLEYRVNETGVQADRAGLALPWAGIIAKVLRMPFDMSVGGDKILELPFGNTGTVIKRLHIETANDRMTGIEIKENSNEIFTADRADIEYENVKWDRVNQANMLSVDFGLDGNFRKCWDTRGLGSVLLKVPFSGADNGTVIAEYLDPLGNL